MKRFLALFLTITMLLAMFASCIKTPDAQQTTPESTTPGDTTPTQTTPAETTTEAPVETTVPADETTVADETTTLADAATTTEKPVETTNKPVDTTVKANEESGCGGFGIAQVIAVFVSVAGAAVVIKKKN